MVELFDSVTDIGIRSKGKRVKDVYAGAAKCLCGITADLKGFSAESNVEIECSGGNREELLVNFLNRVLYEMGVNRLIFIDFDIKEINDTHIRAVAAGEKIKPAHKNSLRSEVKGIPYARARVYEKDGYIIAECIADI